MLRPLIITILLFRCHHNFDSYDPILDLTTTISDLPDHASVNLSCTTLGDATMKGLLGHQQTPAFDHKHTTPTTFGFGIAPRPMPLAQSMHCWLTTTFTYDTGLNAVTLWWISIPFQTRWIASWMPCKKLCGLLCPSQPKSLPMWPMNPTKWSHYDHPLWHLQL